MLKHPQGRGLRPRFPQSHPFGVVVGGSSPQVKDLELTLEAAMYGTDLEYTDCAYVFDVVTDGDDAIDVGWDLAEGQSDEAADLIDWPDYGTEGPEETLWLEEVTAS